jgi:hypothetical protein
MSHSAIPSGYLAPFRRFSPIGAVFTKPASPFRVQRTTVKSCLFPGLLPDILFGGYIRGISHLHNNEIAKRTKK